MGIAEVSQGAVLEAIAEFDELGSEAFLSKYGYRNALTWVLLHDGKEYPSKAILGVAYSKQFPDRVPLRETGTYTGGVDSVVRRLRALGFTAERRDAEALSPATRVWIIRAGRGGTYEQL